MWRFLIWLVEVQFPVVRLKVIRVIVAVALAVFTLIEFLVSLVLEVSYVYSWPSLVPGLSSDLVHICFLVLIIRPV